MNCIGATSYRQKPAGNPSPPFRGEREGPTPEAWKGEAGGAADRTSAPLPRNCPEGRPAGRGLPSLPGRRLGHAHMFGWYRSNREPLPLSARLRGEREGPGVAAPGA